MEKFNLIKIENVESENISNISDYKVGLDIQSYYFDLIYNNVNSLKKYFQNNIKNKEKSIQNKINYYFSQITSAMNFLSQEKNNIFSQYESSLRKNEQKIRTLYNDFFNLKVKNTFLENNMEALMKKEKEYRMVKEKTGIVVENGNIIHNDRKDNEIFILRQENSTLKNVIEKTENNLNNIKEKFKKDKENYEKKINILNQKLNQLKYKIKLRNKNTTVQSTSSINMNANNINTPNLKLNFTINNNSENKGNISNKDINTRTKNRSNNNSNNFDKSNYIIHNSKNKYDSILLNKQKELKKNNINLGGQKIYLIHCQSSGHLNLKNKIINKLNKIKQNETLRQNDNKELSLSNMNDLSIQNKKLLCLTPNNNSDDSHGLIYQSNNKKNDIKKKEKVKVGNKNNNNLMKNYSNNQNIYNYNNSNDIKIIYKTSKNRIIKNNIIIHNKQKVVNNEFTWSHNPMRNNSITPNSFLNMNKHLLKNKNNKSNKILKDLNKTNISKNSGFNNVNNKRLRNVMSNNIIDKNSEIINKLNLTSIRTKNTINTNFNNSKSDLTSNPSNNKF